MSDETAGGAPAPPAGGNGNGNGNGVKKFSMLTSSLCIVLAMMIGAEAYIANSLLTSTTQIQDWTMLKEVITGLNLAIANISGGLLGAMRGGNH